MKKLLIVMVAAILVSGCLSAGTDREVIQEPASPTQVQVTGTATPTPAITPGVCDDSLWDHVYHPQRLKVVEKCKSVTGVVKNFVREADGDYHIRLDVDDRSLVNQANQEGQHGYLVLEPICQDSPTQRDAEEPCQGYKGPWIDASGYVGKHVEVTGSYVSDLDHDGWMEIHPVSSISVLGDGQ